VSFEVQAGETVAVIGESGSGKSTLLRALAGLIRPSAGRVEVSAGEAGGRRVQVVFQDPDLALDPRQPVWKSIAEPLAPTRLRLPREFRDSALALLQEVGLGSDIADRKPHQLSGGQRQRVTIARALAARPSVVLLDEPVSAQDVSLQASLLRLLVTIQQQHGLAYVIVSHDIAAVGQMASRVGVMYAARMVEIGPALQVFSQPRHPYTRALIGSVPRIGAAGGPVVLQGEPPDLRTPPTGCRFRTRCAYAVDVCATQMPDLSDTADVPGLHQVACHRWQEIAETPHSRLVPDAGQTAARSRGPQHGTDRSETC
jgi:oligopeptide/dipeptide ABC transporter ATP-binding protein